MKLIVSTHLVRRLLSVFTFIIGCFAAWLAWENLSDNRHKELFSLLDNESETFSMIIQNDVQKRLPALQRLVSRWQVRGGTPQSEFEKDVAKYIEDTPGYQAIEWVDPQFHVRWVIPLVGNEKAVNLNLGFEERRRKSLTVAKEKRTVTMSKPINLVQGGKGILVYVPIYQGDIFDGFVLAVFRTHDWLNSLMRSERHFADFYMSVSLAGDVIFRTDGYENAPDVEWTRTYTSDVYGNELAVSVRPKAHFFSHGRPYIIPMVTSSIVAFATILSFLLFFLLKASAISRQVQQANVVLEKESYERLQAEQKANEANAAKSKFLAAMSHEIRTPLNHILGVLQLIDRPDLPADISPKVKIAKQSSFFLMTLVNQVLDFARIEAGASEEIIEDFTIGNLISELYEMFKPQADKKGLVFDYKIVGDGEQLVSGNYSHIRQILFNLMGNAIKFTEDGSIKILISILGGGGDTLNLSFEVSDTGYGISQEEQESIFEEFIQSESGKHLGSGTGLGLSISRQLAEFMAGELTVESALGQGTTFTFRTVVNIRENQIALSDLDDPEVKIHPMTILVAEDNSVNQMIINEMLTQDGHTVTVVNNGIQAVDVIRDNISKFDLVLMDIQMPIMNGIDAAIAIRELVPRKSDLPIVALTANAFKSQVDHYHSVGMQKTLTKPVIRADLRNMLVSIQAEIPSSIAEKGEREDFLEPAEAYLDVATLTPLTELMPHEQFNLLVVSIKHTLDRTLPELSKSPITFERISSLCHEIKGMAANVGLAKLAAHAVIIENLTKDKKDSQADRLEMRVIADESLHQLSVFLGKGKNENKSVNTKIHIDPRA